MTGCGLRGAGCGLWVARYELRGMGMGHGAWRKDDVRLKTPEFGLRREVFGIK